MVKNFPINWIALNTEESNRCKSRNSPVPLNNGCHTTKSGNLLNQSKEPLNSSFTHHHNKFPPPFYYFRFIQLLNSQLPTMTTCKSCNTQFDSSYCPNCGQPAMLKRIDAHYIKHEIEHLLHFEKGILFTIRELLLRPGQNIRDFITDNRSRLVKPIIFIIITSLIYTIISHFFHLEDGYVKSDIGGTSDAIAAWVQNHYGYGNIIMGIFITLWLRLFFKKSTYNFFEILILLCFIMGMGMLFLAFFAIIEGATHYKTGPISAAVFIIYATWAIGQFFNSRKIGSYLKSLAAYLLGMATFGIAIFLVGYVADLILKS